MSRELRPPRLARWTGLVLALALVAAAAPAAAQPAAPGYDALLARAKSGDATLDFAALRLAFAETPQYHPYGGPAAPFRDAMWKAYNGGDCAKAIEQAGKVIDLVFVDIDAHIVSDLCYRRQGDGASADLQHMIAQGLLRSIAQSGDGNSPETAYVVIGVDEEYSLLRALGHRPGEQALIKTNGHHYDRMAVKNAKTGASLVVFFNIDRPYGALSREFGGEKK